MYINVFVVIKLVINRILQIDSFSYEGDRWKFYSRTDGTPATQYTEV